MAAVAAGSIGAAMFKNQRGVTDRRHTHDGEAPTGSVKISLAPDVSATSEIPEAPARRNQRTSSTGTSGEARRIGSKKHSAVDRFEIELQSVIRGNRASDMSFAGAEGAAAGDDGSTGPGMSTDLKSLLSQGQLEMERLCEHELVTQLGLHVDSFSACVHQMAEVRAAEAYRKALGHCRQALEDEAARRRQKVEQVTSELQNAAVMLGINVPKFKREVLSAPGLEERRELLREWETLLARRRREENDIREHINKLEIYLKPEDRPALVDDPKEAPLSSEKIQQLQNHLHKLHHMTRTGGAEQSRQKDAADPNYVLQHRPVPRGFITPASGQVYSSENSSAPSSPSGSKPVGKVRPTPHLDSFQAGPLEDLQPAGPSAGTPSAAPSSPGNADSPTNSSVSPKSRETAPSRSSTKKDSLKRDSLKRDSLKQEDHLGRPERPSSSLRKVHSPRGSQSSAKPDQPERSERRKKSKETTERSTSPENKNRTRISRQDSSASEAVKPQRSSLKKDTGETRYSSGASAARSIEAEAENVEISSNHADNGSQAGEEADSSAHLVDPKEEFFGMGPPIASRRSEDGFVSKRSVEFSMNGSMPFAGRHSTEAAFGPTASKMSTSTAGGTSPGRRRQGVSEWLRRR